MSVASAITSSATHLYIPKILNTYNNKSVPELINTGSKNQRSDQTHSSTVLTEFSEFQWSSLIIGKALGHSFTGHAPSVNIMELTDCVEPQVEPGS